MDREYDNTNTGALFINNNRRGQSSPNLVGIVNIEGREYWVSAWKKVVQRGKREGESYYSCAVREVSRENGDEGSYRGRKRYRDDRPPGRRDDTYSDDRSERDRDRSYAPQPDRDRDNNRGRNQQRQFNDDGFIEDDIPF